MQIFLQKNCILSNIFSIFCQIAPFPTSVLTLFRANRVRTILNSPCRLVTRKIPETLSEVYRGFIERTSRVYPCFLFCVKGAHSQQKIVHFHPFKPPKIAISVKKQQKIIFFCH